MFLRQPPSTIACLPSSGFCANSSIISWLCTSEPKSWKSPPLGVQILQWQHWQTQALPKQHCKWLSCSSRAARAIYATNTHCTGLCKLNRDLLQVQYCQLRGQIHVVWVSDTVTMNEDLSYKVPSAQPLISFGSRWRLRGCFSPWSPICNTRYTSALYFPPPLSLIYLMSSWSWDGGTDWINI